MKAADKARYGPAPGHMFSNPSQAIMGYGRGQSMAYGNGVDRGGFCDNNQTAFYRSHFANETRARETGVGPRGGPKVPGGPTLTRSATVSGQLKPMYINVDGKLKKRVRRSLVSASAATPQKAWQPRPEAPQNPASAALWDRINPGYYDTWKSTEAARIGGGETQIGADLLKPLPNPSDPREARQDIPGGPNNRQKGLLTVFLNDAIHQNEDLKATAHQLAKEYYPEGTYGSDVGPGWGRKGKR